MNNTDNIKILDEIEILPAKDPTACGQSIDVCGIFICKLDAVPCQRLNECALIRCNRLSNIFK